MSDSSKSRILLKRVTHPDGRVEETYEFAGDPAVFVPPQPPAPEKSFLRKAWDWDPFESPKTPSDEPKSFWRKVWEW